MDITKFVIGFREAGFLLGDYSTYRAQVSRRLRIVQKKLGRATAKNAKYAAKEPITAENVATNVEYLHLLLLTSERAWAQAMAMKASHSEDNADKNITGSTRQHIVSRLHKASQIAKQIELLLSDTSASRATDIDILEAKAYRYALAGAEEFEKQAEGMKAANASPQRWNACLTNFAAARIVYCSLLKTTKQDLFKEVLATITDPSIRYAAYQSRIPRTVGVPTIARNHFPKEDATLLKSIQQLDSTALDEEEESAASHTQITWRGRKANIVDAAIGQALVSVDNASAVLDQSSGSSMSAKDRANAYDDILIASQDAVDATRRAIEELEKEGVDEGDARMQDLRVTNLAVNYDLIAWRIGRNRVLIGVDDGLTFPPNPPQKPRRPRKDGKEWAEREEPTGRKLARLRERVALYDAILQSIDSIKELRGAVRDAGFVSELDGQRSYFQALKCLNLSHAYAFQSTPKEALALCNRALTLSSQVLSAVGSSPSSSKATKLEVTEQEARTLNQNLENLTSHYRGLVALSQLTWNSESASKAGLSNAALVVERLNEYPASGTVDLKNLVTWPPKLKPVPVKPLFLDVAWNYVEYPGRAQQKAEPGAVAEKASVEETRQPEKPAAKKGWFSFGR